MSLIKRLRSLMRYSKTFLKWLSFLTGHSIQVVCPVGTLTETRSRPPDLLELSKFQCQTVQIAWNPINLEYGLELNVTKKTNKLNAKSFQIIFVLIDINKNVCGVKSRRDTFLPNLTFRTCCTVHNQKRYQSGVLLFRRVMSVRDDGQCNMLETSS